MNTAIGLIQKADTSTISPTTIIQMGEERVFARAKNRRKERRICFSRLHQLQARQKIYSLWIRYPFLFEMGKLIEVSQIENEEHSGIFYPQQ